MNLCMWRSCIVWLALKTFLLMSLHVLQHPYSFSSTLIYNCLLINLWFGLNNTSNYCIFSLAFSYTFLSGCAGNHVQSNNIVWEEKHSQVYCFQAQRCFLADRFYCLTTGSLKQPFLFWIATELSWIQSLIAEKKHIDRSLLRLILMKWYKKRKQLFFLWLRKDPELVNMKQNIASSEINKKWAHFSIYCSKDYLTEREEMDLLRQ